MGFKRSSGPMTLAVVCLLLITTLNLQSSAVAEKSISELHGDACCAGEPYFQETQSCCGGKVIPGFFTDCCDGKGFNPGEGELCCRGDELSNNYKNERERKPRFEVLVNDKTIKGPDSLLLPLVCCGREAIDTRIQVCCDGKAFDMRTGEGDTCCGGKLFHSKDGICCNGEFVKYKNKMERELGLLQCCGSTPGLAFNTQEELCCSELVFKVPKGQPLNETRCCGDTGIFHVPTQTCCVEDNVERGLIFTPLSGFGSCCGVDLYNPAAQTCCRASTGRVQLVDGSQGKCCGSEPMNAATHLCCNEVPIPRELGDACCGTRPYHTSNQTCCVRKDDTGEAFRILNGLGTCCGDHVIPHNDTKVSCCDDVIVSRTAACCGKKPMDPKTQICCGTTILDLTEDGRTECCGEALYNPNFEVCCNKKNIEKGDSCCEDNGYYQAYQSCCHGKVVYGSEADGLACCGKNAFFPAHSTCCYDKMDTVILGVVNAMCCDGKQLEEGHVCCRD